MTKIVHVVWSPQGPLVGYWDPTKAWTHARTMLGVDVAQIEVRDDLPEVVRQDLDSDFDGDDETPQVTEVSVEDMDDDARDARLVDVDDP